MKVKVEFTIDIDAEGWQQEYGCAPFEVRDDVKRLAESTVRGHFESLGLTSPAAVAGPGWDMVP